MLSAGHIAGFFRKKEKGMFGTHWQFSAGIFLLIEEISLPNLRSMEMHAPELQTGQAAVSSPGVFENLEKVGVLRKQPEVAAHPLVIDTSACIHLCCPDSCVQ